jgi:hypothetical protein
MSKPVLASVLAWREMVVCNSGKEMIFKKVYYAPIAERFAVEEDCRLLGNSFQIDEGGEWDYGEAKPIGGFTLEKDAEDIYSNQIWHD